MPGTDKHGMIDGFSSVQAARRAAEREHPNVPAPLPDEKPMPPPESADTPRAQRLAHTALPTKHHIVCYSCTYTFTLTGRLEKVYCPKCRELLECGDLDVRGPWTRDVKTVGRVTIQPDAVLTRGTIIATDIVVSGDARKADLRPTRRIELAMAAVIRPAQLENRDVYIRPEAKLAFDAPLRCRAIEVAGEVTATLEPAGCITIRAGGLVRGAIKAAHLVVEDGGGLAAHLDIRPANDPGPADATPSTPGAAPRQRGAAPPAARAKAPRAPIEAPSTSEAPHGRVKQSSKRGTRKLKS